MFALMNKVNIQIKRSGVSKDFSLPVKIGSDSDSEIIVNTPLPVYYSILSDSNGIKVFDHITNEERTLDSIEDLGLLVKPKKSIPKKLIFGLCTFALILGGVIYSHNKLSQKKALLVQKAKLLTYQKDSLKLTKVYKGPIGYTPRVKKSKKGFIFSVDIENPKIDHLFSFQIGAIDKKNEISITINSIPIFESTTEKNCNDQFCREEVQIDSVFLKKGKNILKVHHHDLESFYILQDLKLIELPLLSQPERIDLERLIMNAQRYLKDSHLSDLSLKRSRSRIREAHKLASKRKIKKEINLKVKVLLEEIEEKFQLLLKNKRIEIQNAITIGDYETAIKESESLKQLFELDEYKQRNAVIRTISQLKRMSKK